MLENVLNIRTFEFLICFVFRVSYFGFLSLGNRPLRHQHKDVFEGGFFVGEGVHADAFGNETLHEGGDLFVVGFELGGNLSVFDLDFAGLGHAANDRDADFLIFDEPDLTILVYDLDTAAFPCVLRQL